MEIEVEIEWLAVSVFVMLEMKGARAVGMWDGL
jgi:hypothetical protein